MASDLIPRRVVMFGGTLTADTWEWDGTTWINSNPAPLPAGRIDNDPCLRLGSSARRALRRAVDHGRPLGLRDANPATYTTFGTGCGGAAGTPSLAAFNLPWLERRCGSTSRRCPTRRRRPWRSGSRGRRGRMARMPFNLGVINMPGCSLLVDPLLSSPVTVSGTSGRWTLPLPSSVSLAGLAFFNQAFVV
jgi:hypothetical protein